MNSSLVSVGIFIKSHSREHIELFLQTRSEEGPLDALLEFPGGKFERGEGPLACLCREIKEELNMDISKEKIKLFQTISHTYPDRKVAVHFYLINARDISLDYTRIDFDNYHQILHKLPEANQKIMENLKEYLSSENSNYLWK